MRCEWWWVDGLQRIQCRRRATHRVVGWAQHVCCLPHANLYKKQARIKVEVSVLKKPKKKATKETVEALAKLLHESGRKAVEKGWVVNKLGLPFLGWDEISEDAKDGRRLMARFLLDNRRRPTVKKLFR